MGLDVYLATTRVHAPTKRARSSLAHVREHLLYTRRRCRPA